MLERLKSRKLWLAIAGVIIAVLNDPIGINLTTQAEAALAATPIAYIVSQGIIDIIRELNKKGSQNVQ